MSKTLAIIFIIGKAMIWLGIPLAVGIWELRRHKKMMAAEAAGAPPAEELPAWLRQPPQRRRLQATPPPAPVRQPAPQATEAQAPYRDAA
ncbi:MAG: hypothetical protein AAGD34_12675 [Pseudomonadota bacterium]